MEPTNSPLLQQYFRAKTQEGDMETVRSPGGKAHRLTVPTC